MWVRVVVCLSVDLRQTGNLSRVYPTSHPMEAGMGLSLSGGVEQKEGWMDRKVCLLNSLYSGSDSRVTQCHFKFAFSLLCLNLTTTPYRSLSQVFSSFVEKDLVVRVQKLHLLNPLLM